MVLVVHTHFGEGDYEESERVLQELLKVEKDINRAQDPSYSREQTSEKYLGARRASSMVNSNEVVRDSAVVYSGSSVLPQDSWSLSGGWEVAAEYVESIGEGSQLFLKFSAREVYLVMGTVKETEVMVKVFDGQELVSQKRIVVDDYDLYTLVELLDFESGLLLEITAPAGVQMHAFTFGS